MTDREISIVKQYLTTGQKRAVLIHPNILVVKKARGEGKSTRYQALRSMMIAQTVPQSVNVWYGPTLIGLQGRMVAGLLGGWSEFGWIEGRDWVKNIEPPDAWPKPHDYRPLTYKNTVSTKTGSLYILGSNDRPGLVNSLSITGHVGIDEARFLNAERMKQDLYPAIRGNIRYWPDNPHVKSMTISTDQPFVEDDADWIDAYEGMMNKKQIYLIAVFSLHVEGVKRRLLKYRQQLNATQNYEKRAGILSKIQTVTNELRLKQKKLDRLRMKSVYFDTGSVLGNLHVLGEEYALRAANPAEIDIPIFKTSFLTIKPNEVANKYYPNFKKHHIIEGHFSSSVDEMGIGEINLKSIHIEDCNPDMELDIEFDFGDMCTCAVSQTHGQEERYIASFEVLDPLDEKDLVKVVSSFFQFHRNRRIHIYKDPSGNWMENKAGTNSFAASITEELRANGWFPIDETPEGLNNPPHNRKYQLIAKILKEDDKRYPTVRIIRHTCENLIASIRLAPRIVIYHGDNSKEIRKDKSSEKNLALNKKPGLSTDHSDHFDIKLWHKYGHLLPGATTSSFFDF